MEWQSRDGRDNRVVDKTGWRKLDNYESLEARSGVYLFANANLQVKYIGKAGAARMVKEVENAINRGKGHGATKLLTLYTNSGRKALSLEKDLVDKYDPLNNLR